MIFRAALYSHLADRLEVHPEQFAAPILEYILKESPQMASDVLGILKSYGVFVPPIKEVRSEERRSMWPDLVCYDQNGREGLLIKIFFSSIPEENTLAACVDRFRTSHATLLIIAPARRMRSLWSLLKRLPSDWGMSAESQSDDLFSITIEENLCLAMVSWEALLEWLVLRGESSEDRQTSEVRRLQHFVCRQDWEADVLFQSGLFVEEVPLLLANLQRLIHDVACLIADLEMDSRFPVRLDSDNSSLFQAMLLGGYQMRLAVHVGMWMEDESNPLWLEVPLFNGGREEEVRRKLLPMAHRYPLHHYSGYGLVPIHLPQEADYCETVYYVVAQLLEIASLLSGSEAT